jgi:hypothetical protein
MIAREEYDFVERLLDLSVTTDLIRNASQYMRDQISNIITELKDTDQDYIY